MYFLKLSSFVCNALFKWHHFDQFFSGEVNKFSFCYCFQLSVCYSGALLLNS
ncbi:hypothetical protein RchiOBHm_Chr2g0149931 [Rosa chinensis]|uniref:Uncharacterized protein n=1 Tax=Rosa chinensis TaxID=74649 RepID=A0A2P6RZS8_ROSCH|nr:hypothetical protein RchiOBHm_Chr2g0149931 [Rosa chinensis]